MCLKILVSVALDLPIAEGEKSLFPDYLATDQGWMTLRKLVQEQDKESKQC